MHTIISFFGVAKSHQFKIGITYNSQEWRNLHVKSFSCFTWTPSLCHINVCVVCSVL